MICACFYCRFSSPSPNVPSKYYWALKNAVQCVQSGCTLNDTEDEIYWMEDGHIIAISLLYDTAMVTFSTKLKQQLAFNETGIVSSVPATAQKFSMPLTVPRSFVSQAASRASMNWSDSVALRIQRQYSFPYVWPHGHRMLQAVRLLNSSRNNCNSRCMMQSLTRKAITVTLVAARLVL